MRMSELFVAKNLRFFENSARQSSREGGKPDPAVDDKSFRKNSPSVFILVQVREPQKADRGSEDVKVKHPRWTFVGELSKQRKNETH